MKKESIFYKKNKELVNYRYKKVHSMVNMSMVELKKWKENECAKKASKGNYIKVINRVIKVISTPVHEWTKKVYEEAGKIISYISRASKIRITRYAPTSKNCRRPKNDYALRNWGFEPRRI